MIEIPHPIVGMISRKMVFIHNLIALYPSFYEAWEKQYDEELRKQNHDIADGDSDIESSLSSSSPISEYEQDLKNIFYQAMVIEVYTFYESSILYLHQVEKIPGEDFASLRDKVKLPDDIKKDNEFVFSQFRVLRNYIAHNIDSKPQIEHIKVLEELSKTEQDISYENGVLTITDDIFLLKALESEYNVLMEICKQLSFKNISYSTKNNCETE